MSKTDPLIESKYVQAYSVTCSRDEQYWRSENAEEMSTPELSVKEMNVADPESAGEMNSVIDLAQDSVEGCLVQMPRASTLLGDT